jgi:hypothetical protein
MHSKHWLHALQHFGVGKCSLQKQIGVNNSSLQSILFFGVDSTCPLQSLAIFWGGMNGVHSNSFGEWSPSALLNFCLEQRVKLNTLQIFYFMHYNLEWKSVHCNFFWSAKLSTVIFFGVDNFPLQISLFFGAHIMHTIFFFLECTNYALQNNGLRTSSSWWVAWKHMSMYLYWSSWEPSRRGFK